MPSGVRNDRAWVGQSAWPSSTAQRRSPDHQTGNGTVGVALNGESKTTASGGRARRLGHELRSEGDTEVIAHLPRTRARGPRAWRDVSPSRCGTSAAGMTPGRDRFRQEAPVTGATAAGVRQRDQGSARASRRPRACKRAPSPRTTFGYVPRPTPSSRASTACRPATCWVAEPGPAPELQPYWAHRFPGSSDVERLEVSFDAAGAS